MEGNIRSPPLTSHSVISGFRRKSVGDASKGMLRPVDLQGSKTVRKNHSRSRGLQRRANGVVSAFVFQPTGPSKFSHDCSRESIAKSRLVRADKGQESRSRIFVVQPARARLPVEDTKGSESSVKLCATWKPVTVARHSGRHGGGRHGEDEP